MRRPSCRTTLAGVAFLCAATLLPASATAAPGELDPSFGNAGQTSFGLSFGGRVQEGEPATVAFPGGGDIELTGTATPPQGSAWRMFAARLQEGGALDPTFGSGGTFITRLPPEEEETNTIPDQSIFAGALEADGAMVGVGERVEGRLSAGGAFDPSFHNQTQLNAFALVELPDGQMLAAGETPTEGEGARYPTLERLLPDGAPDPGFGSEGLVQLPDRTGPPARESASSVLLLPNGELLVAGSGEVPGEQFGWLAEVTATGSLDRSFGVEGINYVPAQTPYQGATGVSLAREPDGTIVLAGTVSVGSEDWQAAAWGFLPDGTPDPAFGGDGVLPLPEVLPGDRAESVAGTTDSGGYVYVDVSYGSSEPPYSRGSYVARLTPSGALDTAYGNDGLVSFRTASIEAISVDPAGRLVVAGRQSEGVFLARLLSGQESGSPAATGGTTPGARPVPPKPANTPLVSEHVACGRVRVGKHHGAERCTLVLRHLHGTWKSALVLVDRHGHRIAERRIKRLHMPVTLVFYLPASRRPTRWTVIFRDGSRVALSRSSSPAER